MLAIACAVLPACSRTRYRLQADRDAYCVIAERNGDPRWSVDNVSIEMDPRSRYFESYNQDCPPLPPDDPTSHQYMHSVNGKKGWKHWHRNGSRLELENPIWKEALGEVSSFNEQGQMLLDLNSALQLAYVHSPTHQSQLETLYLTSLDVSSERFRLSTQFFGGYDVVYNHNGSLVPAALTYDSTVNRYVVQPPFDAAGGELNRLTVGRPNAGDPALQARRRFATAGELLVGFANSFVFEFTGSDANLSASLLNFSFIQPLLRGAGRDVALEALTFAERKLLANLRSYSQFRQGFYTQVAIGELGVNLLNRGRGGTTLQSFSGQGGVGGYLGLLQQLQQIRNAESNLALQMRTLSRLDAFERDGLIGRVQVEQFRQSILSQSDSLLRSKANYELALDRYKTDVLGLPPDLEVELDDALLGQFQLVAPEAAALQTAITEVQSALPLIGENSSPQELDALFRDLYAIAEEIKTQFRSVKEDVEAMSELSLGDDEIGRKRQREIEAAQESLRVAADERESVLAKLLESLDDIQMSINDGNIKATRGRMIGWIAELLFEFDQTVLVQAKARLEALDVPRVDTGAREAYQLALGNRLDFMNGRAALVDSWRLIQVNADALQSVLTVSADGDLRTARNNPVSFRAPTGSARVGVEFDAPFTRLLERNAYRETLINYQRDRRSFIQSRDRLNLGVRALLRQLEQQRASLELQRQSVQIAITRVDLTQKQLITPPAQVVGQRRLDPTTAINLLSAQQSLQNSQNGLLNVWLSYIATRIRLYRELGVMSLDPDGQWIEYPLPGRELEQMPLDGLMPQDRDFPATLPPDVSQPYIDLIDQLPEDEVVNTATPTQWVMPLDAIGGDEAQLIRLSAD